MKKLSNDQSGFTLIELTLVMIITAILSLTMANFIETWLQQSSLAESRASLLVSAENALDNVTNDIMLSGSVDQNNRWPDTYGPGGNQFGWTSGSQTLILAKAAVDSSGNVIFIDPAKYISQKDNDIYYLSGTTLYRRTLASTSSGDAAITTCPPADATASCPADLTIATDVSNLTFTYYDQNGNTVTPADARSVGINITISSIEGGQKVSANYSARMVFRNE